MKMRRRGRKATPPQEPPPPPPPPPPLHIRLMRSITSGSISKGNSRQALQIAKYFVQRAGILVGVWGVQRLVQHLVQRGKGATPPKKQLKNKDMFKIINKPDEHKAANPKWLIDALALDGAALASPHAPWQCPLLAEYKAGLKDGRLAVEFGEASRRQLFCLDPDIVPVNHGSYGAATRLSLQVQRWYQEQLERCPVQFMETVAVQGMLSAVAEVAAILHCDPQDVVPVNNATSAIQAVLQGFELRRGDLVLLTSTTYPAVKNLVARAAAAAGAGVLQVQVSLQHMQQPHTLVEAFQVALAAGRGRVRLAVLDHVVSWPPVLLPVGQLAELCKKVGAKVLVDGAHSIGAVAGLDVRAMGAHFYTSNLHKWGCAPKGAAVLWVAPSEQSYVRPLVTSHGYGLGFRGEWAWQGTQDSSAWLAVPASLAVLQSLDLDRVIKHNHSLVQEAAALLQRRWGTRLVLSGDGQGAPCPMAAVQLPPLRHRGIAVSDATAVHIELRVKHHVEVPVTAAEGSLWVRISAQVYNTLEDYAKLGEAVASMAVAGLAKAVGEAAR